MAPSDGAGSDTSNLAGLAENSHFKSLTEEIVEGKVVAFVGSGLSQRTGQFPNWIDLVEGLCEKVGIRLSPEAKDLLSANAKQVIELSQIARELAKEEYKDYLYERIGKDEPQPDSLHKLLVQIPFLGFVTTNFDTLLRSASGAVGLNLACTTIPDLDYHELANGHIFHVHGRIVHGTLPTPSELVLTRADFDDHYQRTTGHFLHQLLQFQNVVFLGASLREPELDLILEKITALRQDIKAKGKAGNRLRILLPAIYQYNPQSRQYARDPQEESRANQDYVDRGIDVMRYANRDGKHTAVEAIVSYWHRQTRGAPASLADEGVGE